MTDLSTSDRARLERRLRQDLQETGELITGAAVTSDLVVDTRQRAEALRHHRFAATALLAVVAAALVLAILVSPALGRAAATGSYRPELPPDPIELGCYPLPEGLTLDFPYQVRSDGDVDGQRILTLHWDQLDASDVRRRLGPALDRAGLPRRAATVTPFPDLPPDAIVRGEVVLRLPVVALSSADPACADPRTTKRFPADWAPSTEYG